jgi:hypothetical protein
VAFRKLPSVYEAIATRGRLSDVDRSANLREGRNYQPEQMEVSIPLSEYNPQPTAWIVVRSIPSCKDHCEGIGLSCRDCQRCSTPQVQMTSWLGLASLVI